MDLTLATLIAAMNTLPFPVAHNVFLKPQTPPYLIYVYESFRLTAANSVKINGIITVKLELYTKPLGTAADENTLEILLEQLTTYEKTRSYITEEGVNVTFYTFDIKT